MKAPISLQSRLIQHAMFSSILAGFLAWLLLLEFPAIRRLICMMT